MMLAFRSFVFRCVLSLAGLCVLGAYAQAGVVDKLRKQGYITIAHRENILPMSYLGKDKKPIGYAMDICMRVVDSLKKAINMPNLGTHYVAVTGTTRIDAIAKGRADLECGVTTNTANRRKIVDFTIPYFYAGVKLMVKSGSGINGIDDLRGKKIATTAGSTAIQVLENKNEEGALNADIVIAQGLDEGFSIFRRGQVDAFAMDDVLLYAFRANEPNPNSYAVVGNFLSIEPLAIMLPKGDPEFKKLVDLALARIITNFEIYRIYEKWFQSPIPPNGINMNMPMNFLLRDSLKYPSDKVSD